MGSEEHDATAFTVFGNANAPKKLAAHAGYAFTTHAGVSRFRLGALLYLELD
jgi:hypothetical protein